METHALRRRAHPLTCAALLFATLGAAQAEAPRTSAIAKLRLGDSPDRVVAWLKTSYAQCDLQRSLYQAAPGETLRPLAIVAINEGTIDLCSGTPESGDSTDVVFVRFAHPSVAADRGAYEMLLERSYPDPVLGPDKRVRHTLDKVLADLRGEFGRATDEERRRAASQSATLAASLGVVTRDKRDDQTVRLMWAAKGRLADVREASLGHGHAYYECSECGERFVVADIEVTRSPGTRPANRPYVTRVSVFAQNADVRKRQEAWNAQWLQQSPPRARSDGATRQDVPPAHEAPGRTK